MNLKRLIIVLTFNNNVLFRTRNFQPDYRYTRNFVDTWSIDEIVLLNITRSNRKIDKNFINLIREFSKKCFVPITIGGGVNSLEDIEILLKNGADKIVLNSSAIDDSKIINKSAKRFGSQCIVVSVDCKKNNEEKYIVFSDCGQKSTGMEVINWCKEIESQGAGELLINSIDKDGTLEGYDLELIKLVTSNVSIPVLAAGGAGNWSHFVECFKIGKVSGACTTNIFHFTENSIINAKNYIKNHNLRVR